MLSVREEYSGSVTSISIVLVIPWASVICEATVVLKINLYNLYSSLSSLWVDSNSPGVINLSPDGLIASWAAWAFFVSPYRFGWGGRCLLEKFAEI